MKVKWWSGGRKFWKGEVIEQRSLPADDSDSDNEPLARMTIPVASKGKTKGRGNSSVAKKKRTGCTVGATSDLRPESDL